MNAAIEVLLSNVMTDTGFEFRERRMRGAEGAVERGAEGAEGGGWERERESHSPVGVGFGKGLCPSPEKLL